METQINDWLGLSLWESQVEKADEDDEPEE